MRVVLRSSVGIALVLAPLALSCSSPSGASPPTASAKGSGAVSRPGVDGGTDAAGSGETEGGSGGGVFTEIGTLVDYETLAPVAGLTVTDNGVSTTTDATGSFSLAVPASATLLAPTISGAGYSMLLFPPSTPASGTIDFGTQVIPDSPTFGLEQQILRNDPGQALVQIVVLVTGACTSPVGGKLQVLSPAGASVVYMSKLNVPDSALTSFQAVSGPRSLAVVYDVPVGSQLTVAVTHPSCTLAPFPVTSGGKALTGDVVTKATEPGDVNAALVLVLQ